MRTALDDVVFLTRSTNRICVLDALVKERRTRPDLEERTECSCTYSFLPRRDSNVLRLVPLRYRRAKAQEVAEDMPQGFSAW